MSSFNAIVSEKMGLPSEFKSNPEFLQLKLCLSDGAPGLKRERKQEPPLGSGPLYFCFSASVCESLRLFQDVLKEKM